MKKVEIYGTRGSSSLSSNEYMEFGGATTCVLFNFDKTHIMVDCGSGISNAIEDLKQIDTLHLLISHSHLDHISGIVTLLSCFEGKPLHIYGKTYENIKIENIINNITSTSLWPVSAKAYDNVIFHDIDDEFNIDNVNISLLESNHTGHCSLFKLRHGDDAIVTAFDFCHLNGYEEKLIEFAKGCTTLLYDGCFSEEEIKTKTNWGHSTPDAGARIGFKLGCKDTIILHFGVYDDETLTLWEKRLQKQYPNVRFARCGKQSLKLSKMIEIGELLVTEKDNDTLITKILETCMDITHCDGGTLYLLENNELNFKVLINKSKNSKLVKKDMPIDMPSVSIDAKNICAACAREKKLINIPDCYNETQYDFSGVKKYDDRNNYHTKSVIVVPLINEYDDVIGVLQLINATDNGVIIPFKSKDEDVLLAIANQASMAIVNSTYSEQINDLLYGFVKVMSVGIDERTPYNANHTRNMVAFADQFFNYEEKVGGKYAVEYKKRREILMGIWLHDIGKILTPIDIMNKDSRLGDLTKQVENRYERRNLLLQLSYAKKEITKDEYDSLEKERIDQLEMIRLVNKVGFLSDDLKAKVDDLSKRTYKEIDGQITPAITDFEYYQLCIKKGTLNAEERNVMQNHVVMTQKFLSQLNFPKYYDKIPSYAGYHHEFLNGTGYPKHLTEESLEWPCRLITICDIYEALTAKDRPYKVSMPKEKAFQILYDMANSGQLDKELVTEFEKSFPL